MAEAQLRAELLARARASTAVVCLLLSLLAACSFHRAPPPPTEIDETLFRDAIRVLSSDDFEGRQPGTPGEAKTTAYLVEQFRKLGLKPGNGDSYLQPVPLTEITTAPTASLSFAGQNGVRRLAYGKDMIVWSKRPVPTSQLHGSDLVFVGYGIIAPEYGWNDYAQVDVHGKTVLVLVSDPGVGSRDPNLFKGNAMTCYGRWAYKVEQATLQGAAAVILVHDSLAAGYGWDVVRSTWSGAQFEAPGVGTPTADPGAEPAALEAWISHEAAQSLFADAGLDLTAVTLAAAHPGFKPMPLGLKIDAELHNTVRQISSANVVALLPGHARKHEVVLFTAHWDSLGVDPTRTGHAIYNGAVDNATGAAGLVALAQSFIRTQPPADRGIVFLATTAGDAGLLGAEYYVEHPVFSLRETTAVIDVDTLLPGGPTRDLSIYAFGNTDLEDTARTQALLQGRETRPDPNPQRGLYYRTDSYAFAARGIPALYAQAGVDDSARGPAWGQSQIDDYFGHRFRQTGDAYSPDWDLRGAIEDLTLYYQIGGLVARSHRFPRWYPTSDFRVGHGQRGRGPAGGAPESGPQGVP